MAKRMSTKGMIKKLSAKQVSKLRRQLDRSGYADIRVGECRTVAIGNVTICRVAPRDYYLKSRREGSSRAARRADAKRGIRYI